MNQAERIEIANRVWVHCRDRLSKEAAARVMVMGGEAEAFDKNSKGSARLRVQPIKKTPAGFWKGWRWYEIHVGPIPGKTLIGSVAFIFGAHTKNGAAAPFAEDTRRVLGEIVQALGSRFDFHPGSDGSVIVLGTSYKGHFPEIEAGEDLARLIELTLSRFQSFAP